jgi:membrane-bound lytic murein transglycosylase A
MSGGGAAQQRVSAVRQRRLCGCPAPNSVAMLAVLAMLAMAAGCTSLPPSGTAAPAPAPVAKPAPATSTASAARFEPVDWAALPGWYADPVEQAWPALLESCRALVARKADSAWLAICAAARALAPAAPGTDQARAFFERHFTPHRIVAEERDGSRIDDGLITGYFEPLLRGSRKPDARFRFPLYGVPDDLITVDLGSLYPSLAGQRVRGRLDGRRLLPYFSRAQIERGAGALRGRELVWVDDRMDAFFLEIQGSGRVELPDGSQLRLGYADQNGHPYRAIGRVLVERGELTLEQASMQGIRQWAQANPQQLSELLQSNPSYVFFRELPAPSAAGAKPAAAASLPGPPGSLGVPLTPMRSIAIDPRAVMLGAPVWLATRDPLDGTPIERLTFAQDTGGAIIGAIRADLFWGFGADAGERAGRMRERGRLWVLLPRAVASAPAISGR